IVCAHCIITIFGEKEEEGPMPQRSLGSGSGLPYNSFVDSVSSLTPTAEDKEKPAISPRRSYVAVAVLCYVNLLNYSERYTIAGVLPDIQTFFDISDSMAALIQTVFISSFLLLAPVFGYLGDRYNRKYIMIGGLSVWLVTAAGSSLVTKSYFWLLMLLRAMVGIGEASYSTIAPTIIGDLFVGTRRSAMICLFYICIPVGSGLGYITGAGVAHLTGDWRWALRVRTLSLTDIKSYVWSSLGVTATSFLTGALAFWAPTFLSRAQVSQGLQLPCVKEPCNPTDSYIFGAVTVVTGVLGAFLGSCLSRWFGKRIPNVDPLICAIGLVGSAPCLFFTIFAASKSITATYVFIFFAEMLISLNWAVMADILLSIVIPTRRSTAEALQISVCHLLGDAGSPYFVGLISDAIRKSEPATHDWSFRSLQYSLVVCPFVAIVGGLFFFVTSLYITEDRKALAKLVEGTVNGSLLPLYSIKMVILYDHDSNKTTLFFSALITR
uniref:SPNS lysolipid transporter 3, sphingosine-1-phosphate (putative) n=1 Tax=Cyclopterus lumpus TaxID=8103 RepID=A0A8C2ZXI0_CYCLU